MRFQKWFPSQKSHSRIKCLCNVLRQQQKFHRSGKKPSATKRWLQLQRNEWRHLKVREFLKEGYYWKQKVAYPVDILNPLWKRSLLLKVNLPSYLALHEKVDIFQRWVFFSLGSGYIPFTTMKWSLREGIYFARQVTLSSFFASRPVGFSCKWKALPPEKQTFPSNEDAIIRVLKWWKEDRKRNVASLRKEMAESPQDLSWSPFKTFVNMSIPPTRNTSPK